MQDYSGIGLRDRNNDLQQSYGKTIANRESGYDTGNAATNTSLDYTNPVGGFKDNSKSNLHNTITHGSHPTKNSSQG